jgi:hypothetical protein
LETIRSTTLKALLAMAGLLVLPGMAQGQAPAAKAAAEAAKSQARAATAGGGLQDLLRQLQQNRDALIADHDALAKRLKTATDAEKKAIKEKMEAQMKQFDAQQAAIHKQIRDEQRRQRQNAAPKR